MTEQLAAQLTSDIDRYKDSVTPAIILIPGKSGSLGIGSSALQSAVERAVGADIL
jgi:V/A-type H+-transporting ATPase subunit F